MNAQPKTMIELDSLPVAPSHKLTEKEEQLIVRFEEIDLKAIDRLVDGGTRLVEWGTAAIGIFFAALALLQNPSVLTVFSHWTTKVLGIGAVIGYLLAVACGFFASIPKHYRRSTYSLTEMERQFESIYTGKNRLVVAGTLFFMIGTAALGALIVLVLLSL